jgi:hypothetical protein
MIKSVDTNVKLIVDCSCGNKHEIIIKLDDLETTIEDCLIIDGCVEGTVHDGNIWCCDFDCYVEELNALNDKSEALSASERNPGLR